MSIRIDDLDRKILVQLQQDAGRSLDDIAKLVIGIAAKNDEHIQVITTITNALDDPEAIDTLTTTKDVEEVLNILGGEQAA